MFLRSRPQPLRRVPAARRVHLAALVVAATAVSSGGSLSFARTPRADVAPDARDAYDVPDAHDAPATASGHRQVVVAHVGPRAVTAGDLEDHLARVPRYQLRAFGRTAPEVVHGFLEQVMVRDVLLSVGAEEKHLDRQLDVEQSLDRMLSGATLRQVLASVGPASAVSPDEVQRYFDANRARYESNERINIWRILCASRDEALTVLAEAKKDGTVPTFTRLSREHNLDKATALRGGNLGFVNEAGVSNEPGVQVEAPIVKAAEGVKDGEFVPAPVQEGGSFSVVWRRGTQGGVHRTVNEVRAQIQDAIIRQKREAAEKALLDKLRAEKVSHVDESLLGSFDISIDDGTIGPRKRERKPASP